MLQISGENVNSQQENERLNERSLSDQPKRKLIRVSSQLGEFSIVNIVSWFDPVSGICVGSCFLLWHLVQVLIAEKEEDKE